MITINLPRKLWFEIQDKIYADVPLTARMFKTRHLATMGFSVREHQGYGICPKDLLGYEPYLTESADHRRQGYVYLEYFALDFVDEPAATLFRLRFL